MWLIPTTFAISELSVGCFRFFALVQAPALQCNALPSTKGFVDVVDGHSGVVFSDACDLYSKFVSRTRGEFFGRRWKNNL